MLAEVLFAFASASPSAPMLPSAERLAELCETTDCRHDVEFSLKMKDGTSQRFQFPLAVPAVRDDAVSIFPGETVEAVAEFDGETFVRWRRPKPDEGTGFVRLSIKLEQMPDGGMMATTENKGSRGVKLAMFLMPPRPELAPEYTSSCPVNGNGFSTFETWPDAFLGLMLGEPKLLKDTGKKLVSMACE